MLEALYKNWWMVAVRGVIALAFGVLAVAWPGITLLSLAILWGIYALIDGFTAGGVALTGRSLSGGDRLGYLGLAVLGIAAGLIALVWPGITVLVLLLVIAVWAIIAGVMQIAAAFRMRRSVAHAAMMGIAGLVTLALGIFLIVQPGKGALALVLVIGAFAIAWGVALLVFSGRLYMAGRRERTTAQHRQPAHA